MNFVILCGGSGSRLWPKSREKLPKQFLKMTNHFTMLQNTLLRVQEMIDVTNINNSYITVICNKDHGHIVEVQANELSIDVPVRVITEPKGRDSAPAICISSLIGLEEEYTCIMPCDHIFDTRSLKSIYDDSLVHLENSIVTFGIKPTHVETGYGYIKTNEKNETLEFVEKPDFETAKTYYESGDYLWNAGIFIFKNTNMIQCFQAYAPDILKNCQQTLKNTSHEKNNSKLFHLSEIPFSSCRSISVDYAIMEPLCKDVETPIQRVTLTYDSHWNDIGSFSALYKELPKDDHHNVVKGDVIVLDSSNCYIESERSIIAAINIHDLIVVETDDAILVCPQDKTQDVKRIVQILKENKREEAFFHKKVFRPWGFYINIYGSDRSGFKVKTISVYPGKKLSLQSHHHRSEHWVIVQGNAKVTVGEKEILLQKDQSVYIPIETLHRIENVGSEMLEFTETQIGEYLGEDDIVRYEDDFGRV